MTVSHATREAASELPHSTAHEFGAAPVTPRVASVPWLALLVATLLSFASTGYVPLSNNNIFHLGLLLRTYELPQLANDPFVQSLPHFLSGFWMLFAGLGRHIAVEPFLAAWLFVTHAGFLGACAHLAASLGLHRPRALSVLVLLLAVAPPLAAPAVGGGGLMLDYFTHSELANATLIAGLSFAIRHAWTTATMALAVTAFLNAFMAAWMAPLLAALALVQWRSGEVHLPSLLRSVGIGALVGLPCVVPPLLNLLRNPEFGATLTFSYRDFLWQHYPQHFFLSSLPGRDVARLLGALGIPLLAFAHRDRAWRDTAALVAGSTFLLACAIVAERLDSRVLLNLHFVRSTAIATTVMLTTIAVIASRGLVSPATRLDAVAAPLLAASLLAGRETFLWAVPILLFVRLLRADQASWLRWLRPVAWLVLLVCLSHVPLRAIGVARRERVRASLVDAGTRLGTWAAQGTPPDTLFLFLPSDYGRENDLAVGFTLTSERPLWYSFKYGAAVMWTPSYHDIWQARRVMHEHHRDDPDARVAFARSVGVDVVVLECANPAPAPLLHRVDGWCAYAAARPDASAAADSSTHQ